MERWVGTDNLAFFSG